MAMGTSIGARQFRQDQVRQRGRHGHRAQIRRARPAGPISSRNSRLTSSTLQSGPKHGHTRFDVHGTHAQFAEDVHLVQDADGDQQARRGGSIHTPCSVVTRITPSVAYSNWARIWPRRRDVARLVLLGHGRHGRGTCW
jgi:hypothetical protein